MFDVRFGVLPVFMRRMLLSQVSMWIIYLKKLYKNKKS